MNRKKWLDCQFGNYIHSFCSGKGSRDRKGRNGPNCRKGALAHSRGFIVFGYMHERVFSESIYAQERKIGL